MTAAEKAHKDLIDQYTKILHDHVDLLGREVFQALKSASSGPESEDNLASLEIQVRDQAEKIKRLENTTRAAQDALAQAEARAREEKERADTNEMLLKLSNRSRIQWYPPTEVPPPGRYIVRHKAGTTFFLEPIGNHWPDWVDKWMEIPE